MNNTWNTSSTVVLLVGTTSDYGQQNTTSNHTLVKTHEIIVVDNQFERWTMFLICLVATIWVFVADTSILYVIVQKRNLQAAQKNYYLITATILVYDTISSFSAYVVGSVILFMEQDHPRIVCRIFSAIPITCMFSVIYLIGILSLDRYLFFCHPFKYEHYCTKQNVVIAMAIPCAAVFMYITGTEIMIGRVVFYVNLHCQLEDVRVHAYIQFILIVGPVLAVVVFSTVQIKRLIKRQEQIIPTVMGNVRTVSGSSRNFVSPKPSPVVNNSASSVKVILLLSGVFFATYVPMVGIRAAIFSTGITWEDVETRRYYLTSILLRVEAIMKCIMSPALHPIIFYKVNGELRQWILNSFPKRNKGIGNIEN